MYINFIKTEKTIISFSTAATSRHVTCYVCNKLIQITTIESIRFL